MTKKEIFWKLLSEEKKQELFNILGCKVPNYQLALGIIDLPFCIGINDRAKAESMLHTIRESADHIPHVEPMAWKIHEMLYDD